MARIVEITVPVEQTESLLDRLKQTHGLIGLRVQKGGSPIGAG